MKQQALKFKMENSLTRAKSEPNSAGIRGIFKRLQSGFEPIVFSWTSAFFLVFMPRWTWWCHNGFFSTQVHFLEATSWSSLWSRTTNAQGENSLHCSALHGGKSNPNPNFYVRPKHIFSATSAQFFRYLWFMPSLGVRSP